MDDLISYILVLLSIGIIVIDTLLAWKNKQKCTKRLVRKLACGVYKSQSVDAIEMIFKDEIERDPRAQEIIVNLLLDVSTLPEIHTMKKQIDRVIRKYGFSIHSLIFELMNEDFRRRVLDHFQSLCFDDSVNSVIVLSDIDDTCVSTFKDQRFPFNTIYPGAVEFYHALIRSGAANDDSMDNWSTAKHQVVFVTARPSILSKLTRYGLSFYGLGENMLLQGSLVSFLRPSWMMRRKLSQSRELVEIFPESKFFLVGDNGQADIDLGKALIQSGVTTCVFIHDIFKPIAHGKPVTTVRSNGISVVYDTPTLGYRHGECAISGIVLFRSYATAALEAFEKNLISKNEVLLVLEASATDFASIKFTSSAQRSAQREILLRDVSRVLKTLVEHHARVEFLERIHKLIDAA